MIVFTLIDGNEHAVPVANTVEEIGTCLRAMYFGNGAPVDLGGVPLAQVKAWLVVPDAAQAAA